MTESIITLEKTDGSITEDAPVTEAKNIFKSVLAMVQRARDLVNGDLPVSKMKSDSRAYIAFTEVEKKLVDERQLFNKFMSELFNQYVDQDEDDNYKID